MPTFANINGANTGSIIPSNPTVPTPVPTKAPSVVTPVVNSQPAQTVVQNATNKIADATTAIQNQNLAAVAANPYSVRPGEDMATYNARIKDYNASKNPTSTSTSTSSTPPTADQMAMDTPPDNHTWIYNNTTGDRAPLENGTTMPAGYSSTNPKAEPTGNVIATTSDSLFTYKKFDDGTYAQYDIQG